MTIFTRENVTKSYNGQSGCMCGCNGTYSGPDTRATTLRFNKLMQSQETEYDTQNGIAHIDDGNRTTVVYFNVAG